SHHRTGTVARATGRRAGPSGAERSPLFPKPPGANGLWDSETERRAAGQWSDGIHMSAVSMPIQAHWTILESERRRSVIVSGNLPTQRTLASAFPTLSRPLQKLTCAPPQ